MKRKQKDITCALALALTLVLVATAPVAAFADAPPGKAPVGGEGTTGLPPSHTAGQLKGQAVVKAPLAGRQLLVNANDMDVALIITDDTLAIDSRTALPASLEELKEGDSIYVYYSAAMTRSLPPQSRAMAIVTQVEKGKSHAQFFTVREITSRSEEEVRALNQEGDLIVTFLPDISLSDYKTKQVVTLDDIQVGSQLFVWYDMVALSYPGQTSATQAVFVGQEEGPGVRPVYSPWARAASLTIKDQAPHLAGRELKDHKGLLMVPLRSVAEELGFKVVWKAKDQSILLDDGIVQTTLHIGQDSYYKASSQALGLTQNFNFGAAPMLVKGTAYVPVMLFNLLYSDNEAVKLVHK